MIETIPQQEAVCDIPKQVNREDISVGDVPFVTGNEPYAGGVSNRPATEKTEYATYMPPPNPALEEKLAKGAKKRAKLAAKEAKEREKLEAKAAKLRAKFEAKEAKRRAKASKKKHTGLVVFLVILILLLLSSIAVGAWFVHDREIIDLEEMFPWMPEIPDFPEIGFLIGVLEDEAEEPDEDETEDEDEETDDPDETEEENEPIEKDEKITYCDAVTDGAFALVDSKSEVMTEDEYEKILKKAKDVSEENEISIILIIDKDIFGDKDEAEKYMIDACDTLFENYSGMMDDYCIFFIDSEQNSCYSMISETAAPDDGDEYKKLLGSFGKNVKEDGYKKAIIKLLDGLSF